MRVQHNIMAMNAYRNYNNNTSALSKNLEKLSSGYSINRAGDDAAGLAISEKMRAQITGLDVAQTNAQDGISLVQTAEGALTEVHDMLNRMYELANKAANGTYETSDRVEMQKEIDELTKEIDRISETANFNGIKLLDGTMGRKLEGASATTNGVQSVTFSGGGEIPSDLKIKVTASVDGNGNVSIQVKMADGSSISGVTFKVAGQSNDTAAVGAVTATAGTEGALSTKLEGGSVIFEAVVDTKVSGGANADVAKMFEGMKITVNVAAAKKDPTTGDFTAYVSSSYGGELTAGGLKLQIGDDGVSSNQLNVSLDSASASSLGIDTVDVTSQDSAIESLAKIESAINTISGIRGTLGANQNRLEHTINNLSVTQENIQNAESAIRDTDVADEMMAYTKNNILIQSAQAMLAQSNQVPQGVLQLLQ